MRVPQAPRGSAACMPLSLHPGTTTSSERAGAECKASASAQGPVSAFVISFAFSALRFWQKCIPTDTDTPSPNTAALHRGGGPHRNHAVCNHPKHQTGDLAERSKAVDSRKFSVSCSFKGLHSTLARGVGSNPTVVMMCIYTKVEIFFLRRVQGMMCPLIFGPVFLR